MPFGQNANPYQRGGMNRGPGIGPLG
jgi:hypothetical protein